MAAGRVARPRQVGAAEEAREEHGAAEQSGQWRPWVEGGKTLVFVGFFGEERLVFHSEIYKENEDVGKVSGAPALGYFPCSNVKKNIFKRFKKLEKRI